MKNLVWFRHHSVRMVCILSNQDDEHMCKVNQKILSNNLTVIYSFIIGASQTSTVIHGPFKSTYIFPLPSIYSPEIV